MIQYCQHQSTVIVQKKIDNVKCFFLFFFFNYFELENIDFCARQVETTFIIKLFNSLLSSQKGFGSNASGLPMGLRVAAMSMAQLDASGSIGMGAEPKDLKQLEYCCGIGEHLLDLVARGKTSGVRSRLRI